MNALRDLLVVDVSDPRALTEPLRQALFHNGPAVLPRPGGAKLTGTAPLQVPPNVALVIETSGTTGAPKRVALSAQAVLASAEAALTELGGPGTWLLLLPSHYIAGVQVFTRALLGGSEPVVLHPEPFSTVAMASRFQELVDTAGDGPLYTSMVPAQLHRILDDVPAMPVLDSLMKRFDRIVVGGQAIPASLLERAHAAGYRVTRTYGSSETAGGCVWDGRAIGAVNVAEIDGRLAISGPVLAHSYLDDPERTARCFVEKGGKRWYLSDDAGAVTPEGVVSVHGRLDDVIVSGGVKVSLGRIERVIHADFNDPDAIVVGVEHDTWGHVPVVVSTKELDLHSLRLAIGVALGPEARPEKVLCIPSIPLLPSGKPDRLAIKNLVTGGSHGE